MYPDARDELISAVEDDLDRAKRLVDSLREELILLQTQRAIFIREHSKQEEE